MSAQSYRSRRVFVDTSAYFALTDLQDANHGLAVAVHERLVAGRWRLFTTNFVVAETHALLLARLGRAVGTTVLQRIDRSATTIVRIALADERRARDIISRYDDKDFSLTDAMSFAVMERLQIPVAFTFDRDFTQYGFQVLQA